MTFFVCLFVYFYNNNIFSLHWKKKNISKIKGKFFATYELYQNLRESLWVEDSIGSYGDVIRFWWTPLNPRGRRGLRVGEEYPREARLSDPPMYWCDAVVVWRRLEMCSWLLNRLNCWANWPSYYLQGNKSYRLLWRRFHRCDSQTYKRLKRIVLIILLYFSKRVVWYKGLNF